MIPDHIKLVTSGTMPGNEQWSVTLSFGVQDGPYALLDLQDFADAALEAWRDMEDVRYPWMADNQTIDRCTAYVYDGGVLVEQAISAGNPITGGAGIVHPNQVAACVTLLSATPGRKSRGRIYMPVLVFSMLSNGRIDQADAAALATNVGITIEQMHTAFPLALRDALAPAVISQVGAGLRSAIVQVRCGNVLDTQRRRRESLAESYSGYNIDLAGA